MVALSEYVPIPDYPDWPDNPTKIGTRVRFAYDGIGNPNFPNGHPMFNRTGTVVTQGRGVSANAHWTAEHEPVLKCTYGTSCDALVDSEGPVIRWDDQDPGDESLDWYPGQAMGVIEPIK